MTIEPIPVGARLREWRQRRRLSQLDLALDSDVSARHLSFLETGRSRPSREMLIRLAERLDIPLRERNRLLNAAGFASHYPERALADAGLLAVRRAVDQVLLGHEPYPALAVDRHWTLVAANQATGRLIAGVSAELLAPPVNVLRLSLHPDGLARRIVNFPAWRMHVLDRLRRQVEATADPVLAALADDLARLPAQSPATPVKVDLHPMVLPFEIETSEGVLSLFATTTVFGTPLDVTVAELAIEAFYPADEATAEALRRMAGAG